jgi:hypothetical protein
LAPPWSSLFVDHPRPSTTPSKGGHTGTSKGGAIPETLQVALTFTPTWMPPLQTASAVGSLLAKLLPIYVPPCWLAFTNQPPPRVAIEAIQPGPPRVAIEDIQPGICSPAANPPSAGPYPTTLPTRVPIAHRTRSWVGPPPSLALFSGCCPLHKCVQYHIPTAKSTRSSTHLLGFVGLCQAFSMTSKEVNGFGYLCSALERVDSSSTALSVLNSATGKFLEHCLLHRNPWYNTKWDTSYANELCCLCQGIGSGPSPRTQQIAGTNAFLLIDYKDILSHKHNEICHTMVVCKVRPEKDDPDWTHITIGGNRICYPGDVGTNTALLKLIKLILNSVHSRKGACFSTIDIKNFYLDTPMPDPEYVCVKISDIPDKLSWNTTSWAKTATVGFSSKFGKAVMVFPKPASLPTIFSDCASSLKAAMKLPRCR